MKKQNKIGIISMKTWDKEPDNNAERFKEESEKLGFKSEILFNDLFAVNFNNKEIEVYYNEELIDLNEFKLIIPCISIFNNDNKLFFIEVLEGLGVNVKNKINNILISKNKSKTLLALQKAGVPIIPSAITNSEYKLKSIFGFLGDDEFVYRLNQGSLGKGVAILNSKLSMISTFELLSTAGIQSSRIIFQKFIKESSGRDIRVIVANNKVIAAMERTSNGFDFRANLSSGGKGKEIEITKEVKDISLKAIKAIGLDYGGVDILISDEGPLIIEINANPGVRIEEVTGKNIVGEIIKNLVNR